MLKFNKDIICLQTIFQSHKRISFFQRIKTICHPTIYMIWSQKNCQTRKGFDSPFNRMYQFLHNIFTKSPTSFYFSYIRAALYIDFDKRQHITSTNQTYKTEMASDKWKQFSILLFLLSKNHILHYFNSYYKFCLFIVLECILLFTFRNTFGGFRFG